MLWGAGALLHRVSWTEPRGEPFSVALVQGNIAQNLKFNEDALAGTLETYRRLVLQSNARLILLPETALPLLRHEVPQNLVEQLRDHALQNGGDVLIRRYLNATTAATTTACSRWVRMRNNITASSIWWCSANSFRCARCSAGSSTTCSTFRWAIWRAATKLQAPLDVAGQRVAVNICYEDVFGEEIIRALPQATLLANFTNDAWYGHSYAAAQHDQMSQMRAMESGRMMLRATNTGVTSIIGADGKVLQRLPQHQEGGAARYGAGLSGPHALCALGQCGGVAADHADAGGRMAGGKAQRYFAQESLSVTVRLNTGFPGRWSRRSVQK